MKRLLFLALIVGATMCSAHAVNFIVQVPNINVATNSTVGGTNFINELVTTNGITLGGVRNTAWPSSGSSFQTLSASNAYIGTLFLTNPYPSPVYSSYGGLLMSAVNVDITNAIGTHVENWPSTGSALVSTALGGPIYTNGPSGFPGVYYNGTNWMNFAAPASLNSNMTVFIVMEATNVWGIGSRYLLGGTTSGLIWGEPLAAGNYFHALLGSGVSQTTALGFPYEASVSPSNTTPSTVLSVLSYRFKYGGTNSPAAINLGVNGTYISGTWTNGVLTAVFSGQAFLGTHRITNNATYGFRGWIYEAAIYTNALTMDQCSEISQQLKNKYRVRDPSFLMADGDQGLIGGAMDAISKTNAPVYWQMYRLFLPHASSIAASTVRTLASAESAATNSSGTLAQNKFVTRPDHLYLLYFGGNQIVTNSAAVLWGACSNAMLAAKSKGYIVPVMTLLPSGTTNEAERIIYNNLAREYYPRVGHCLVDFTTLPFTQPTDYTNTIYYVQEGSVYVPTVWQSTACAQYLASQLKSLISTNLLPR